MSRRRMLAKMNRAEHKAKTRKRTVKAPAKTGTVKTTAVKAAVKKTQGNKGAFHCPICNRHYKTEKGMKAHLAAKHPKN